MKNHTDLILDALDALEAHKRGRLAYLKSLSREVEFIRSVYSELRVEVTIEDLSWLLSIPFDEWEWGTVTLYYLDAYIGAITDGVVDAVQRVKNITGCDLGGKK